MAAVFISWYLLKHWLTRHSQSPHQRGIYEALYTDLHNRRPELWSRAGPLDYVQPKDRVSKIKWWLIVHWMSPKRLPPPRPLVGQILGNEPLGTYNRLKRHFAKRWTSEIEVIGGPSPNPEVGLQPVDSRAVQYGGTVGLDLEGDNGMARSSPSLDASEEGDVVLAGRVEDKKNSGVLVEEGMRGSREGGNGTSVEGSSEFRE